MFPLRRSDSSLNKTKPKLKESHVQFTTHGSGDYYGTGSRNPEGRVRDATVGFRPVDSKQLGTPPKSLA
jgi:hypothetical protein